MLSPNARGSSVLMDPDNKESSSSSENSNDYQIDRVQTLAQENELEEDQEDPL